MMTKIEDFNFTISVIILDYENNTAHSWEKSCRSKMNAEECLQKIKEMLKDD